MRSKYLILSGVILFSIITIIFSSCSPDDPTTASDDWKGNWTLTQGITDPSTPSSGAITKLSDREIEIDGELFGLYSSFVIKASVNSTSATFDKTEGEYRVKGTASLKSKDEIIFKITIIDNNGTEYYERIAITKK